MLKDLIKGVVEAFLSSIKEWWNEKERKKEEARLLHAESENKRLEREVRELLDEKDRDAAIDALPDDAVTDELRRVREEIKHRKH